MKRYLYLFIRYFEWITSSTMENACSAVCWCMMPDAEEKAVLPLLPSRRIFFCSFHFSLSVYNNFSEYELTCSRIRFVWFLPYFSRIYVYNNIYVMYSVLIIFGGISVNTEWQHCGYWLCPYFLLFEAELMPVFYQLLS